MARQDILPRDKVGVGFWHTIIREQISDVYKRQVETFFYPHGVEHLLCSQVMHDPNIDFIVNSHYLWEYFKKSEPNIVEHGVYFEPAFSKELYKPVGISLKKKYRLFFYARPNNPRNLFAYGVFLLDMAIRQGIIDTSEWEICCAGPVSYTHLDVYKRQEYDLKCINLYFADNSSTDDTILVLERQKEMYADRFGLFEILRQPENGGFGKGSNAAARAGKGDFIFFYNIDTEIFPDAFLRCV